MGTEVHFSNIQQVIANKIKEATQSIRVAMAWFTDKDLFEILIQKSKYAIQIELILNKDEINLNSGIDFKRLIENGGRVFFPDSKEFLMHHKFCIIDDKIVLNGSFNWTNKANYNTENLTILKGVEIANKFKVEFLTIKNKCSPIEFDYNQVFNYDIDNDDLSFGDFIRRSKSRKAIGNYTAALFDLKKAFNLKNNPDLFFDLADCQYELKDYQSSITNYSNYLSYNQKSSAAYNNRALVYEKCEEIKKALNDYSKAIEIDPSNSVYYKNRADLYYSEFKMKIFREDRIQMINHPKNEKDETVDQLVTRLKLEEKYSSSLEKSTYGNKAIEDYKKLIELTPNHEAFYLKKIGNIYKDLKQFNKSIDFFTKCSLKSPTDPWLFYQLSWSQHKLINYKDAIENAQKAVSLTKVENDRKIFQDHLNFCLDREKVFRSISDTKSLNKKKSFWNWLQS